MSRSLPPHPNLEHLKKQAKALLRDLKQRNPALKLADALHTLAREYGFASWPKLKVYVESLPRPVALVAALDAAPSGGNPGGAMNAGDGPPAPVDAGSGGGPDKVSPFVGKWTANLSKSKQHPSNPFQNATLHIAVAGDRVTIIDVVVDASKREEHRQNTILVDGNEHPSEYGNGYVLTARWRGSHVFETVAHKDGQVAGWGKYEVSADGQTLTISNDEQVIVLDRT